MKEVFKSLTIGLAILLAMSISLIYYQQTTIRRAVKLIVDMNHDSMEQYSTIDSLRNRAARCVIEEVKNDYYVQKLDSIE